MAYKAPYLDNTGLHISTYQDILDYYVDNAKIIFGQDIYLGNDSADYQQLSIIALAAYESTLALQDCYNARSPRTASYDAMVGLVTINGLEPKAPSYSTVTLVLTGLPYTSIVGGVAKATSGSSWVLPQNVVLDSQGNATVVATAQEQGAITALAGEITQIQTPTYGWSTVNNPTAAFVGQPAESLADLKVRQRESVALPAQTTLDSLKAGISAVPGVTDYDVLENDSNIEDSRGLPPHSITAIVQGGSDYDIAKAIALRKNEGVYSNGDQEQDVTDYYGTNMTIRFFRPEEVPVYMTLTIKPLAGYSTAVGDEIINSIVNYLSKMPIGGNLYISQIWEAALSVSPDIKPYFSLKSVVAGTTEEAQSTDDLVATFKQKFTVSSLDVELVTEE